MGSLCFRLVFPIGITYKSFQLRPTNLGLITCLKDSRNLDRTKLMKYYLLNLDKSGKKRVCGSPIGYFKRAET